MKTLGVACVGTGFIGPVHIEATRRLGHQVVGVLGSSPEKSNIAAQQLNIPRGYLSFDEILHDPSVDVVHLTSPNKHHFEQCSQAIAAGKHVLCEKPLAMNTQETKALVELARTAKVVTGVNYNVRFYPLCLEARAQARAGALGQLFHVTGSYLQDWLLYDTDFNWRVLAEHGGQLRALADIGSHWLDLITFITGSNVKAVCADLLTVHPIRKSVVGSVETFQTVASNAQYQQVPIDTEDYGSVLFELSSGARGVCTVSQVVAGRKNCIRFDIAGSKAALAWDSEEPNTMTIGYRNKPNETLSRDPGLLAPGVRPYANYPGGHAEGFPDTFKQLFRCFYDSILTGQPSEFLPTFADGHHEVAIGEAILASQQQRAWVNVAY